MSEANKIRRLLTVIIPVYNEHSTVIEVIKAIDQLTLPIEKEVIVVDDGSDDGTAEKLSLHEGDVRIFTKSVNEGKGSAIRVGLAHARGDVILLQDADLETDPNEYASLLRPILEGRASVVYGSRFLSGRNSIPATRLVANRFLTSLANLMFGCRLTDMETAYKVFTSEVALSLDLRSSRFEIEPEITARICRLGYEIQEVPISYNPRTRFEGKKIRFRDGIKAAVTIVMLRLRG
jgi:glycosyltransferase involved in cell wall biosynthesis